VSHVEPRLVLRGCQDQLGSGDSVARWEPNSARIGEGASTPRLASSGRAGCAPGWQPGRGVAGTSDRAVSTTAASSFVLTPPGWSFITFSPAGAVRPPPAGVEGVEGHCAVRVDLQYVPQLRCGVMPMRRPRRPRQRQKQRLHDEESQLFGHSARA